MRQLPTIESGRPRSGFTLVEMLVATGLVVLIMLLFASVFSTAVGTMTQQRGMANNDQKARTLQTVLRGDLQKMTYRQPVGPYADVRGIVPLAPGDIVDPNQRGYFYISENDPDNDTDDVLQFTAMVTERARDHYSAHDRFPFVGKAATLNPLDPNQPVGPNQPERDDGLNNGVGISRAAEICYFMRGGNLYRRVLLLRDPLPHSPFPFPGQPSQGANGTGARLTNFTTDNGMTYTDGSRVFWRDFDYAATWVWTEDTDNDESRDLPPGGDTFEFRFHTIESLDNSQGLTNFPIAIPQHRFGFNIDDSLGPVEFDSNGVFFGRFTVAETSDSRFNWPGQFPDQANHPLRRSDLTLDTNTNRITQYNGSNRLGEDLLLTNIDAFDVEVWDDGAGQAGQAGQFVDLGGTGAVHFNDSRRYVDTWHPSIDAAPPPNRPLKFDSSTGTAWSPEAAVTASSTGPVIFPDAPTNDSIGYRLIESGTTGSKEPEWNRQPGTVISDGSAKWLCFDNRIGLKMIRITVRYRDTGTNLPRQVTLIHSFVE